MGGHALRGAVSAWLALIVLQTLVTTGSDRVKGALDGINGLVQRALSPNVPAIPDRRAGAKTADGGFFHMTPAQLDAVVRAANAAPAVGQAFGPGSAWSQLPDPSAYAGLADLNNLDPQAIARWAAAHPNG